jgi:hypothetical protein
MFSKIWLDMRLLYAATSFLASEMWLHMRVPYAAISRKYHHFTRGGHGAEDGFGVATGEEAEFDSNLKN